ncbi:sulfotransferase 1B1-like [Ptychodera flava]|uniref:sulfotransferase 1B1-like n=1 Tax=Ptychodera flava TaxID=63121 RepID=UPI00396A5972
MDENTRYISNTFQHNGVPYLNQFNRSLIETPEIVKCREDDVFVASYPKSGTTWLVEMVSLVMNGGNTDFNTSAWQQERHPMIEANFKAPFWLPWVIHLLKLLKPLMPKAIQNLVFLKRLLLAETHMKAAIGIEHMKRLESPRLLKSHLPYQTFPTQAISKKCKIVYVARNPKDTAVSYFYHCSLGMFPLDYKGSWNEFYELYVNGKVWYGSWFDHVLAWWQRKGDDNVLFLKYEDMKKDPKGTVKTIAVFLDVTLSDDIVDKIVEFSSFKSMKSNKAVNISLSIGDKNKHQFIRKGVVGDWMNYFTVSQNKEYEKIYKERMKGSGLDFEW